MPRRHDKRPEWPDVRPEKLAERAEEGIRIAANWSAIPAAERKPLELAVLPYLVPCTGGAYGDPLLCIHAGQPIDAETKICFVGKKEAEGWKRQNDKRLKGKFSSETEEHWTPPELVIPARDFLGGFDTDPASTPECNSLYIRAANIYTRKQNGILRRWNGRCFVNPPSSLKSKESAWKWWLKFAYEFVIGNVSVGIFIVFNPSTFQTAQLHAKKRDLPPPQWASRCEPMERIDYLRLETKQQGIPEAGINIVRGGAPPHPSAILMLSDDPVMHANFAKAYGHLGEVLPPSRLPERKPRAKRIADQEQFALNFGA